MAFDKEQLLKPRLPEAEVELPGVGTVRVRGLSRGEVLNMQKATDIEARNMDGPRYLIIERKMIAKAMVDPELSEDEVQNWQMNSPAGELEPVTKKIQELSGMSEAAEKEAVKTFRDDSGDGVRVLSGDEALDDSGGTSGENG